MDVAYWRGVAEGLKQREVKPASNDGLGKLFKQFGEVAKAKKQQVPVVEAELVD